MKVCVLSATLDFYGGAAQVVVEISNGLKALGHDVTLVTPAISPDVSTKLRNIEVVAQKNYISAGGMHKYLKEVLYFASCSSIIKRHDIIFCNNFPSNWACVLKKTIWMCNEPTSVEIRHKNKRGIKKLIANLVVGLDKLIVKRFLKSAIVADDYNYCRFLQLYGMQSIPIPYGINVDLFKFHKRRARDGKFNILQVGVVTPEKNQMRTLSALKAIRETGVDATVTFVGKKQADYWGILDKYILDNNLVPHVRWSDNLPPEAIRDFYINHDVLFHPVLDQGGWLSAFEAVATGIPVILSPEFTGATFARKNGLALVTNSFESAVEYVGDISDDELLRRSEWVIDNLRWRKFVTSVEKILSDVLNGTN